MSEKFPVYVVTATQNGTERLRIGTAARVHDGFELTIGVSMNIGPAEPARALHIGAAPATAHAWTANGSAVFPPYGRSKGKPVQGATMQDLEYYAAGCRRTLVDPGKERWHDKERTLLAAIEAEIARQGGGRVDDTPPLTDDDCPF